MDNYGNVCLFCHEAALATACEDDGAHFVSCNACGARWPKTGKSKQLQHIPAVGEEKLLRTVIDESPDIILIKNWDGIFLLCNEALAKLYDTTPEAMIGKSDADFNPNVEQVEFYLENIQSVMRSGETQVILESSTDVMTGEVRYFQSIKKPLKAPDGSDQILVIAHDITDLQKAHLAIEENEKRYSYAMDASESGIWDWDIVQNEVHHNTKWCQMLGLSDSMTCHDMSVLEGLIHPEDRIDLVRTLDNALAGDGAYSHEHRMIRPDGEEIWVYDRGRVVEYDDEGRPLRMVGSISDISQRKHFEFELQKTSEELARYNENLEQVVRERTAELEEANRKLVLMATVDPLTGIGNRTMLNSWLGNQSRNQQLMAVMVDVDHFKKVNDRFGHDSGDKALIDVARCLSTNLRQGDLVIRWGGEEFLLIINSATVKQAHAIAESLRKKIMTCTTLPDGKNITASFGIAPFPHRPDGFDSAINAADKALYQAKENGRNCVVCHQTTTESATSL